MIVGGLIVLVLTAALVGPYFVNWTSYRADFEREASAILGQRVTVEGSASARLLPFPSVTFTDVTVGDGAVPLVTIEEFSMDAELAPLLAGDFVVFDMRLVRPIANVSLDADGRLDWSLKPSSPFDPAHVKLQNVRVENGKITLRDGGGGPEHMISELDVALSARSLRGPWRVDGTLRFDGARTAVSLSTGIADDSGRTRLRVRANPDLYPFVVEADGDLAAVDGKPSYAGTFKLAENTQPAPDLREGQGGAVKVTEAARTPAYRVAGRFLLDHRRLDIAEYRIETGPLDDPYTADGKAYVDLGKAPRFEVEASGAQVRFDEALAVENKGAGLTLAARVDAIRVALLDLPRPAIPGTINVNLPAIVAGDTTVRDARLSAQPGDGGWQIKSLSATLPGRATIEGKGLLRTGESDFGFDGSLLLAVAQPSGFAAWLSSDVDEAIRRLPAAGFSADVELSPTRQRFSNLELILGAAKFRGEIEHKAAADTQPSLAVKLDGGAVDVDAVDAFASLFVSDRGSPRFADRDVDIALTAGPLTASGLSADKIDTALRLRGTTLEIDRLALTDLEGASLSATGSVTNFTTAASGNVDASVVATDLAPILTKLGARYPENRMVAAINQRVGAYPGLLEDAQVDLVLSATRDNVGVADLAVSAKGVAGGTNFTLSGSGSGVGAVLADAKFKLEGSADNPDAGAIITLLGGRALPLGAAGRGQVSFSADGSMKDGVATLVEFSGDDLQAQFDGFVSNGPDGAVSARGALRLEAADLDPWLMTTGNSVPGLGIGLPASLTAYGELSDNLLVLSDIEGEVADGPVSGDVNVTLAAGIPHVTGSLTLDALDLAEVSAMVLGDAALDYQSEDHSDTPFSQSAVPPFSADVDMTALSLAAGPFGVLDNAHFDLRIDKDALKIADLKGDIHGGVASGLIDIKNTAGDALVSVQLKLVGGALDSIFAGTRFRGKADVSATLSANGKSAQGLLASLGGSGTASVRDVSIPGFNPDALGPLIREADRFGRDIDAANTATFASSIAGSGIFESPGVDLAFTVASGVVRAPPVTLTNPKASITGEVRADFNDDTVAATGQISFVPGDEALQGSEPALGFSMSGSIDEAMLVYDVAPLAQFLTQRALEKEQQRVEALQAALLEKQRLRREVRYYASLQAERDAVAEARRLAEEEARRAAEEAARIEAEMAAKAQADEAARKAAEEAARADAERRALEEALRRATQEEAKQRIQQAREADEAALRLARDAARKKAAARQAPEAVTPAPKPEATERTGDPLGIGSLMRQLKLN